MEADGTPFFWDRRVVVHPFSLVSPSRRCFVAEVWSGDSGEGPWFLRFGLGPRLRTAFRSLRDRLSGRTWAVLDPSASVFAVRWGNPRFYRLGMGTENMYLRALVEYAFAFGTVGLQAINVAITGHLWAIKYSHRLYRGAELNITHPVCTSRAAEWCSSRVR